MEEVILDTVHEPNFTMVIMRIVFCDFGVGWRVVMDVQGIWTDFSTLATTCRATFYGILGKLGVLSDSGM